MGTVLMHEFKPRQSVCDPAPHRLCPMLRLATWNGGHALNAALPVRDFLPQSWWKSQS
ncbi:hypothetical protein SACS_1496 [Parasaccharibacter apium]|uniref:Uncharacterized protein n=1 Tax=Parasaccharibacter apium TaxID=1510841 RepID=A0A7U7J1B8_9PROT|nr:hypothetical protein SACS_1496 [Parasaccharibacter apium]